MSLDHEHTGNLKNLLPEGSKGLQQLDRREYGAPPQVKVPRLSVIMGGDFPKITDNSAYLTWPMEAYMGRQ